MNLSSYLITFIEGVLTFISPCILPMLPIYFMYLAGAGVDGDMSHTKRRLLMNSIGFVIGFTAVFVALGATVTSIGYFLVKHKDLLRQISAIVMVLFGLNIMGILRLSFINLERRIDFKFNKLDIFSSIVFGAVFGFGWTPCLGPFLGSALILAGNSKTMGQGIALLLVYSTGLGIPFVLSSIVFDKLKDTFKAIQKHNRIISTISGVFLVVAGILVFTDSLKYLSLL